MKPIAFCISPGRISLLLLSGAILLTALSLTGHALDQASLLRRLLLYLFDLDREGNVSTLYPGLLLGLCSVLLYVIYRGQGKYRYHWLGLALAFAYLAVDEAARIHELPSNALREHLTNLEHEASDLFVPTPWVVPAGIALLVGLALYLPFLFALPRRSAWLFVGAGAVYVSGAVLFEMLAWHYRFEMAGPEGAAMFLDAGYILLSSVEELLEMCGATLFIYALLSHISRQTTMVTVRFASEPQFQPARGALGHKARAGARSAFRRE